MRRLELTLLAISVAAAACTSRSTTKPHLPATTVPVLHSIDNSELRRLMDRMNSLVFERNLTDLELDNQRRRLEERVTEAMDGVDQAIDGILAAAPKLNLEAGEEKTFRALATDLRRESRLMKGQAQSHQFEQLPDTLQKMTSTCTACHELFRDSSKTGGAK